MARYYAADDRPTEQHDPRPIVLGIIPSTIPMVVFMTNYIADFPYLPPALSFVYGNVVSISKAVLQNRNLSPTVIVSKTHKVVIQGHIMWTWN